MTTDLTSFADSEFNMRYKEPFVTGGLNKKFAGVIPRGLYRGFRIEVDPGAGDRTVQITEDATYADHVALYLTGTGYSLTLRRTTGDFLLSLSAYTSQTVIIAIYANYAVGATTTALVRAYTEAEYNGAAEKDELLVLGSVAVPASGTPVADSMITGGLRTFPWKEIAEGAIPWVPLHRNAGFEWADEVGAPYAQAAAYWRTWASSGGALGPSSTDPHSGDKCMELSYVAGTASFQLYQPDMSIPVEEGQRIRIRLFKKMVQAATGGTINIAVDYVDKDGTNVTGSIISVDTSVDASYEEIDETVRVPAGLDITHFTSAGVVGNSPTFAAPGAAVRFDDFQVWVETTALDQDIGRDYKGDIISTGVRVRGVSTEWNDSGEQPLIHAPSSATLRVERTDQKSSASLSPVSLELLGQLKNLGGNLLNSAAQMHTPRIETEISEGTTNYTLLWEIKDPSPTATVPIRLYAQSNVQGSLVVTYNAVWGGSSWSQDDASETSQLYSLGGLLVGFAQLSQSAGSAPWVSWEYTRTYHAALPQATSDWIGGSTHFGENLRDASASILLPRLYARMSQSGVTTSRRTLIMELPDYTSTLGAVRLYRSVDPFGNNQLEITYNAEWDNTNWDYDDSTEDANLFLLDGSGLSVYNQASGGAVWPTWGTRAYGLFTNTNYLYLGDKRLRVAGTLTANSNPAGGTALYNELPAKGYVKSWIACATNGGGGISSQTGLNAVASITGSQLRVSFPGPLISGAYSVATQVFSGGTFYAFTVAAKALGNVDLQCWDAAGAPYSVSANPLSCMVMVFGEQ